jgi:hypothetical protein
MDVRGSTCGARRRSVIVGAVGVVVLAVLAGLVADVVRPSGVASAAGGPPTRVITYEVRGWDNQSDLEQFAAVAAEDYADPRGWSFGGSVAFVRVPSGGSFTLWLAAAAHLPAFGAPCDTSYSCTQGRNVIINETRWLTGSPAWNASGASLADYHHMVLNHETGHWIGFGHQRCGGPGQLAPVMQQQSISLQGCRPNPWPLDSERRAAAARLGVEIRVGSPQGSFDTAQPWWHGVRVAGWAIDPDVTTPDLVQITVDGAVTSIAAALPRADVAAAHPGYGAGHGFGTVVPAANGPHTVCAFAMNVAGSGGNTLLDCRTVVVGSPFGTVEAVQTGPRLVRVSGWVVDPDTAASTSVHVYVDGTATPVPATLARGDIGGAFPGVGAAHGFNQLVAAASGPHRLCTYGINIAAPGANSTLDCRTIVVGGSPFGAVDLLRTGPGKIEVAGWAADRDVAAPDTVHVYVDGRGAAVTADRPRNDIAKAFPLYGANHGYDHVVNAGPGGHLVCVYGINVSGPGANSTLGCRFAMVGGSPFGALDTVHTSPGTISVAGWAIDRDTAGPDTVHVYVDAVPTVLSASAPRPDLAASVPLYGSDHGFVGSIPAGAGVHRVCAYGIDVAGPGASSTLGCRTVGVPA